MARIFSDLFEGVDGDPLYVYSPNWTRSSSTPNGRIAIFGGRAKHDTGSVAAYHYRNDVAPATANYTVAAKFYFPSVPSAGQSFGICARGATNAQSYYFLRFIGNTGFVLARSVSNTTSTLGTYPYSPTVESEVLAEIKVEGDQISAYLDGALILGPFTDTTFADAGVIGVRAINVGTAIQLSEMSASDIVLAASYSMPVTNALMSVVAQQVSIRAARRLVAGVSSYTWYANVAQARVARRSVVSLASLAVAGLNAAMRTARRLVASPAPLALNYGAVQMLKSSLSASYSLAVSPASLATSGASVGLRVARRVAVQAAAFTWTANPIAMRAYRRMPVLANYMAASFGNIAMTMGGTLPNYAPDPRLVYSAPTENRIYLAPSEDRLYVSQSETRIWSS